MIYRTYKYTARTVTDDNGNTVDNPFTWNFQKADNSTDVFYNYDDLTYASGGAVASWQIDEDYLVNNNSTVNIVKPTDAVAGQIIALIDDDDGTYYLGVVNTVDNEKLQITYKQMTSIFDVDVLNPTRYSTEEEVITGYDDDGNPETETQEVEVKYLYDIILDTAKILACFMCGKDTDRYLRLPMTYENIEQSGITGIWGYDDDSINLLDWIQDLFDEYNVIFYFDILFDGGHGRLAVWIEQKNSDAGMIKGNIRGMTVEHNEDTSASATVCTVLESEGTKDIISTWYLLSDNTVTTDAGAENRVQPYKLTTEELDPEDGEDAAYSGYKHDDDSGITYGKDEASDKDLAEKALLYSDFNHYVNLTLYRNSKMYPKTIEIGDTVRLILDVDETSTEEEKDADYEDKVLTSIFTGRKLSSSSAEATLIFGKMRINYTDLMQMRVMRKVRD